MAAGEAAGYESVTPCFEARNISVANVPASRHAICEVLRSPDLLAEMPPLIDSNSVDGDIEDLEAVTSTNAACALLGASRRRAIGGGGGRR